MTDHPITHQRLNDPWLLAVWPGMGNVALGAGGFLIDKLLPQPLFTVPTDGFFDIGAVQVRDGVVGPARLPENRFYAWKNPGGGRDLVIFVGEAQPTTRGYAFCEALLRTAEGLGVKRVVTFASVVTPQHPTAPSRVFAVATSQETLADVRRREPNTAILAEGAISGLNGTLLAAAASRGLEGVGLLAEVPQVAANVPYLKASHAVLTVFSRLAGVQVDLTELAEQAVRVEKGLLQLIQQLGTLAAQAQEAVGDATGMKVEAEPAEDEDEPDTRAERARQAAEDEDDDEPEAEDGLDPTTMAHIEELFLEAAANRDKALRLKALLDKHGVFKRYEDRFLNLFLQRESETPPT
jgi:proteasome assembly chaperone (PAC2) family protein